MDHCPKCQSQNIHRSRSRSRWDVWRKEITGKRQFRCHACNWRGWGIDARPNVVEAEREATARALAPQPPNLQGTALAREERRASDVDFAALDRAVTIEKA
jgi:hypothetical protein